MEEYIYNAPELADQSMCYICYLCNHKPYEFINSVYLVLVHTFRNEIIPKLKEYNIFFEGRKALQLTSKEVNKCLHRL